MSDEDARKARQVVGVLNFVASHFKGRNELIASALERCAEAITLEVDGVWLADPLEVPSARRHQ